MKLQYLRVARRIPKPDGTPWVSGTHHIIFSTGFALQSLVTRYLIVKDQDFVPTIFAASVATIFTVSLPGEREGDLQTTAPVLAV